jgi:hypothetical protein
VVGLYPGKHGTVMSHQNLASSSSTAPGGNVGIGFTVRMPDSQYKFYVESRFHYATNRGLATRIIRLNCRSSLLTGDPRALSLASWASTGSPRFL